MYEIYIRRRYKDRCNREWDYTKGSPSSNVISEKEQPASERLASGGLYYSPIIQEGERVAIGEKREQDIVNASGKSQVNNTTRAIKPEDVSVVVLNTDGKKTHRELLAKHRGLSFPLKSIADLDKYKYEIEIDGESVYVSADNVEFSLRDLQGELDPREVANAGLNFKNMISIDGMLFLYSESCRGWKDLHYVKSTVTGRYYITHAKFDKPKGDYRVLAMPNSRAIGHFGKITTSRRHTTNSKDTFNNTYYVSDPKQNMMCKEYLFSEEGYKHFIENHTFDYEYVADNTLLMQKKVHDKIHSAKKIAQVLKRNNAHGYFNAELEGLHARMFRQEEPEDQWIEAEF